MVVDYVDGRLWKEDGPDIFYEIGVSAGAKARRYAEQNGKVSLTVVSSPTAGELVIGLDEDQAAMVVGCVDRRVFFRERNVRSRKDAMEVILIATSGIGLSK